MNEQIKAGSDIHAGDGGYSIGTKEKYDEFVKIRNKSLAKSRIRELAVEAGASINTGTHPLTGVVDGLTMRNKEIEKFAELLIRECCDIADLVERADMDSYVSKYIRAHFGVEE